MPISPENINDVKNYCQRYWDNIIVQGYGNISYLPDGTIHAETSNGDGTFTNYEITQTCCSILKNVVLNNPNTPSNVNPEDIHFDLDKQKCVWVNLPNDGGSGDNGTTCITDTPIKIVLNPVGNDGAFFTLTENNTCSLNVKFNYLFKFTCETLNDLISKSSDNPIFNPDLANQLSVLNQTKFELESKIYDINNELDNLVQQNVNLNYSISCNEFPTNQDNLQSTPETKITASQTLPFVNTGFGSLTNTTDLSASNTKIKPIYNTKFVNFCLTEDGLNNWRQILGEDRYSKFINGDSNSYTCLDVVAIDQLNKAAISNNQNILIFECNTPFNEKTKVLNRIETLSNEKIKYEKTLFEINNKITTLFDLVESNNCSSLLGQFENLSASVTLDIVNEDGTTTEFYSQTLFNQIDNLYNYLVSNTDNSGFLVCGQENESETWTSGCTSLIYPEFTNGVLTVEPNSENINVSICELVKDTLYNTLYDNSGVNSIEEFNQSLSPNVFNSNWLTYETTIDDLDIINAITNNQIKLNIVINNSCGNFCLLVDQINMTKVCEDSNRTNIFISKSPGFNLTRVIDNKKSWVQADSYTQRDFHIGNYNDVNQIRQTEYTVDEERLILNTKEIDLTVNLASAIENDVWCYLVDNNGLLSGVTNPTPCINTCGDNNIDFSGLMSTNIVEIKTLENFEHTLLSELIDVKSRKVLSSYPSLKAIYDRYMNTSAYGLSNSNEFDYKKMDAFAGLIKNYWDDLIEQVVPSTTIWGDVKVYTNTLFDQQKFKYRTYTSLLGENNFYGINVPSPINSISGQCENVEVVTTLISGNLKKVPYNNICISQMNNGSEFIGNIKYVQR